MNKVFIIGRLTKDPEIRVTNTGKKVANFTLAVNEGKNREGQDITQFFNFNAWEKLAEILELYVKKGVKVAVIGRLQNRSWDKPDGSKGYATDITANELDILSTKAETEAMVAQERQKEEGQQNSSPSNQETKKPEKKEEKSDEEDLPEIDVDDMNVQMPF